MNAGVSLLRPSFCGGDTLRPIGTSWLPFLRACSGGGCDRSEFLVLSFRFTEYWDIGVGLFPSCEKGLVGPGAVLFVTLFGISACAAELRQRSELSPGGPSPMIEELFKLGCSLRVVSRSQVCLATVVKNL